MSYRNRKTRELADKLTQTAAQQQINEDDLFVPSEHDEAEAERAGYSNYSYWHSTLQTFGKDKTAVFFLCILLVLLAFTFVQPFLPGQKDAVKIYTDANGMQIVNHVPGGDFIFGTNSIGQDLWSRVWSGTRTSLLIGFSVAGVEVLLGVFMGVVWGYVRRLDFLFTEVYNVLDNIPQTIVLILISYILRPSISTLILAMCLTGWLDMARFIRNMIVIIRDRDYNIASRCLGTSTFRIIFRNLLPYLISIIMLRAALSIPAAIGNEVFLTYIGLGLPLDIPSLGNLINSGRVLMMSPNLRYQLIFPTVVLSIATISFYIIGNAFADASDPKNHI